ncbi:MAG: DNA double-strand break repair nuclease NurA [Methanotrichaceae archaeon]|nr:DNA double-strand break repair nuclease NurA [Methanotrichaceae archaeon]
MGYTSRRRRRPNEYASRAAHGHIIKDADVQAFLAKCDLPKRSRDISLEGPQFVAYKPLKENPIQYIIAVDGGYNEVPVQVEFPSATVCFFQIGALIFSVKDLQCLDEKSFIDPDDMARLKQIQRLKLILPIRNVGMKDSTLTDSVRKAIYEFFQKSTENEDLISTLKWFIFQEYAKTVEKWILSSCPACHKSSVVLSRNRMTKDYTFECTHCGGQIYLTDVFRLHEAIDDEMGAGGIPGYVTTTIEQLILVHLIRLILKIKPALLNQVLFVKDGPLAFFGQTANMHKPMRELVGYLFENHNLYLAGLEKSGPFVEHADEIADRLENGSVLILDNDYIYKYILPGKADPSNPYGRTTYYGNKLIFKTIHEGVYIVSVPTQEIISYPKESDLRNLNTILTNIELLKCDMYDNSLLPVALANKLVSLANHPSSRILQKFAKNSLGS